MQWLRLLGCLLERGAHGDCIFLRIILPWQAALLIASARVFGSSLRHNKHTHTHTHTRAAPSRCSSSSGSRRTAQPQIKQQFSYTPQYSGLECMYGMTYFHVRVQSSWPAMWRAHVLRLCAASRYYAHNNNTHRCPSCNLHV